ncbi:ABC transporter permease [Schaedlerella arabinosiphila]|nr:ABC transporter permease subunit [Schaedlerella arabinosiphila]
MKSKQGEIMANKKKANWKAQLPLLLMTVPGMLYLFINNYIPICGLFIAFKDIDYSKGIFKSDWNGFENFKYLFRTEDAFIITRNTILYNLTFIILNVVICVAVAVMLSEVSKKFMMKFYQTALLLPHLISIIIIAYIAYAFLNSDTGFINHSIQEAMGRDPVNFYADPKYWPFILVIVQVWKTMGYTSIIYFSAILGIDRSLYEAAVVDGAGKMKQIFYITLPLLRPTIITMVLMNVGRIFYSDFGLFLQVPMNQGALFNVTNTIDTYVYRALLLNNDIGMASAAGLYQSIVGFLLVLGANLLVRKMDPENALF